MARKFYTAFFYAILPLVIGRLVYRMVKAPAYSKRIAERLGVVKPPVYNPQSSFQGAIWVHAVSVGETIAAAPMIKQLQLRYPETPVVVTTMTPTGSERVHALFGESVFHVYAPYDLPGSVRRFINRIKPRLLVIMETELWPNTIHGCHINDIPVVLANARLSEKSARGYRKFSKLTAPMLQELSCVAAQHDNDAQRFISLGIDPSHIDVTGSIKFDIELSSTIRERAGHLKKCWFSDSSERKILLAASTHDGEEEQILHAFLQLRKTHPSCLLILVPRHPERFDTVVSLCEGIGINTIRRSSMTDENILKAETGVIVGDTMGELLALYGVCDVAFVGGSLIHRGGHNMLEPAAWGVPVVTGESDFNFAPISELLQQAGALKKIANADELVKFIEKMFASNELCEQAGASALSVVEQNRGALNRLMTILGNFLSDK